jgi:hypothetical protein
VDIVHLCREREKKNVGTEFIEICHPEVVLGMKERQTIHAD